MSTTEALPELLRTFERTANRFGELWERCQGKGWPEAESAEFHAIRDERLPAMREKLRAALAAAAPSPAPEVPTIDLWHEAYKQLQQAASDSKWIPPEYYANDWIADCCRWMREGPMVDAAPSPGAEPMAILRRRNFDGVDTYSFLPTERHDGSMTWEGLPVGDYPLVLATPGAHPAPTAQPGPAIDEDLLAMYVPYPSKLHPDTARLVSKLAFRLAIKLRKAEQKYGYSDGWRDDRWKDECQKAMAEAFDYPWEHMPTVGRINMRTNAKNVISAALAAAQEKNGERNG